MTDTDCVAFLQDVLPRLRMRWPGFRKVRQQVCKRIARRMVALDLSDTAAYRAYLDAHPNEWMVLDVMCRVTISRFYRDRGVFDVLRTTVLPDLAQRALDRGAATLHGWSAGCASGEEVYTLRLLWALDLQPRLPSLALHLTATDADAHLLDRARRGCYPAGTLRELPEGWIDAGFEHAEEGYCIRPAFRHGITWLRHDVRRPLPGRRRFDLILCRNLVFTYFDEPLQRACLDRIAGLLHPHGALVLGAHEHLPEVGGFTQPVPSVPICRKG